MTSGERGCDRASGSSSAIASSMRASRPECESSPIARRYACWRWGVASARSEHELREVRVTDERVGPDALDKFGFGNDFVRPRDEELEKVEGLGRQAHDLAV